MGLTLEVALSPINRATNQYIRHRLDPDVCVDNILRTIRQTSPSLGGALARRRIAFTSFSPQVCTALNWKQPNCEHPDSFTCTRDALIKSLRPDPVFFSSRCGQIGVDAGTTVPSLALRDMGEDYYSSSVAAGVEFAKMNNLLGIFFDSGLLVISHHRFRDSALIH